MQGLVEAVSEKLLQNKLKIATAESCTGGMIAAAITDRAGSSTIFDRGFVTYSNLSKHQMLAVPEGYLDAHGAVSSPVAQSMAEGALKHSKADIAVAVTGIAGPGGARPDKPVGLVYIGYGVKNHIFVAEHHFEGDREAIRRKTAQAALKHVLDVLEARFPA